MPHPHLSTSTQPQDTASTKSCVSGDVTQLSPWNREFSHPSAPTETNSSTVAEIVSSDTSGGAQIDATGSGELANGCAESERKGRERSNSFEAWLSDFWSSRSPQAREDFENATTQAPISAASLRELEIGCIMNNVRLRHDINFDRELHFRPNLDGDRGREKVEKSKAFWSAVATELQLYLYLLSNISGAHFVWTDDWIKTFRHAQKRVPGMFEATKEILMRLMPEQDQERLKDTLDKALIMQQIERGLFDLAQLANWFANLLKSHCAPMRDPWVDQMSDKVSKGAESMNSDSIVEGLKELFGILEAMKLDVANHQIRYLRTMLLESTVAFEQNYYMVKIASKQIDTQKATNWYRQPVRFVPASVSRETEPPLARRYLIPFVSALVTSILPIPRTDVALLLPDTFKLDFDRLRVINADAQGLVYHLICRQALEEILKHLACNQTDADMARSSVGDAVRTIVGFPPFIDASWTSKQSHIALELVRIASGNGATTSSDFAAKLQVDENLIVLCGRTEAWLQRHLRPTSDLFAQKVAVLREQLFNRVLTTMEGHVGLNAIAVFEALVSTPRSQLTGPSICELILKDITRRLSHIGVLHWQVWAPLVYAKDSKDTCTITLQADVTTAQPARVIGLDANIGEHERELAVRSKPNS